MADEHDLEIVQVGEAGDDRVVVAQGSVAVQLKELVEDQLDVLAGLRALGMARNLDNLPGLEMRIDFAFQRSQLASQPADLFGDPGRILAGPVLGVLAFQLRETCFHLVDWRLERQPRFRRISGRREILGHASAS